MKKNEVWSYVWEEFVDVSRVRREIELGEFDFYYFDFYYFDFYKSIGEGESL